MYRERTYSRHNKPFYIRYGQTSIPERGRLFFVLAGFALFFAVIAMRLVDLGGVQKARTITAKSVPTSPVYSRPDIVDRNGNLLATDIRTASLFANPSKVLDVDDMVDKLKGVFAKLDVRELRNKLSKRKSKFVWVKRILPPEKEDEILGLGLAGLDFRYEPHRAYPSSHLASHILGYVDIDNKGRAGIERYIDSVAGVYFPKTHAAGSNPVLDLSIDIGVQHIMRQELMRAKKLYRAKAAAGVVLDVTSGEVIAMVSLPDYDPHNQKEALKKKNLNRIASGVFELGSIFKVVTTAMALDTGVANIDTKFDARQPIKIKKHTISDYHAKKRWLSVREIFIYSSNIGSARMAMKVGIPRHKAFLKKLGLLGPIETELGKLQAPLVPRYWKEVNTMTIAFGHGLSVSPLQFAASVASLVNGGYYVTPTFQKRSRAEGRHKARKVIKSATSNAIRQLLRLNVVKGTGRNADAPGYRVGGKTGTAEKAINGRYHPDKLLTSFISVFPSDDPAYVVLVMLDEPQPAPGQKSRPTAGTNAAKVTARIITRIGSKLGVIPQQKNVALSKK